MGEAISSLEVEIKHLEALAIEAELRAGESIDADNANKQIRLSVALRLSVRRMSAIAERLRGLR
jgi:hypothetical protein